MQPSTLLLLGGLLLAPGLSLPFPSGQQRTGGRRYRLSYNIHLLSAQLASEGTATLTCQVESPTPEIFSAKWLRNGKPVGAPGNRTGQPMQESQGKYHYSSEITLSGQEWHSADTYDCVVGQNATLLQARQKSIDKNTAESRPPSGSLHPLQHEEIILANGDLDFDCSFRMDPPKAISIRWLMNRNILPEDAASQILKEESGGYYISSKLKIPRSHWSTGDTFTCSYVNEDHPWKFAQQTAQKPQGQK